MRNPLWLLLALGLAALGAHAADPNQWVIAETLLTVQPYDQKSQHEAADRLAADGQGHEKAIRQVLNQQLDLLAKAQAKGADDEIAVTRRRVNALNEALARIEWKFSPTATLTAWLRTLKRANGEVFDCEADPIAIVDPRLEQVFPNQRFYLVYFPGYRGGAAPPEELLESLRVPEPLREINVVAVGKDKTVRVATDNDTLLVLFQALLPPVKTAAAAADATYAYTRLSESFFFWGERPLPFSIVPANVTTVKTAAGFTGKGKATVVPVNGNAGELCVTLTFDAAGKPVKAEVLPQLELKMLPMPM